MRNWFIVLLLMFLFTAVCCRRDGRSIYYPSFKDDLVRKELRKKQIIAEHGESYYEYLESGVSDRMSYTEYLDSVLKDVPFPGAGGRFVAIRSSDIDSYDTIVNGIPYRNIE